jgi:hypothetical protein
MDRAAFRMLIAALAILAAPSRQAAAREGESFEPRLRPFLDDHGVGCHGPELQKRRLRLDWLPAAFDDPEAAATWVKVPVNLLVMPGGLERTEDEFRRLYQAASFRLERVVPARDDLGVIEGLPA